jgi:uncharacterized protein (TIGR02266 family)
MHTDKRQGQRVPIQVWATSHSPTEVRLWLDAEIARDDFAFCYSTQDISATGIFLQTDSPLPVGTPMELELTLPGGAGLLRLPARVVRVVLPEAAGAGKPGMGLAFGDLTEEDRERLVRFLESAHR